MFGGPVVASAEHIYAITESDGAHDMINSSLRGPGRIMEMATGLAEAAMPLPGLDQFEITASELAIQLADDPDWPAPIEGGRAFVFPRLQVSTLRKSAMSSEFQFTAELMMVAFYVPSKRRDQVVTFLEANGYDVDVRSVWDRWFGKKAG